MLPYMARPAQASASRQLFLRCGSHKISSQSSLGTSDVLLYWEPPPSYADQSSWRQAM